MDFVKARFNMVEQQIRPWDVLDFDLLDVLDEIERERFVLPEQLGYAYADLPLKLANGGVMLEPKIVARMVQGLKLQANDRVLEVGTGSGYATAVLAKLAGNVVTYDIDETQLKFAKQVLDSIGYTNIHFEHGDGLNTEHTQLFDAIYIGGSLPLMPEYLFQALQPQGGRMVVVVGGEPVQRCVLVERQGDAFAQTILFDTKIAGLQDKVLGTPNKFVF